MRRLHLIDGTFELFRAHYSRRPDRSTPDGRPSKATVGVVASILSLIHDEAEGVTHLAAAFDNPIESFRNDLFAGYKTGAGIDPELRSQFDMVEEGMRAIGVTVWSMDRWEADDALATGVTRWRDEVDQVRIMTPDKDLGQCLEGVRVVQVDRIRDNEIDEAALRARRGIGPASIPDWLALVGDTADGIPGLPRFGEKTASALLAEYEHIERIPDLERDWAVEVRGKKTLGATLRERRQDALLYKRLATLVTHVPLEESLDDLEWRGLPDAFDAWCQSVGVDNLQERYGS